MSQLKRLLDEPGSELDRVLLESALDEEPPRGSRDRALVALGVGSAAAVGAAAVSGAGAGATVAKGSGFLSAGFAKWAALGAVVSAVVGGGVWLDRTAGEGAPVVERSRAEAPPDLGARGTAERLALTPPDAAAEPRTVALPPEPARAPRPTAPVTSSPLNGKQEPRPNAPVSEKAKPPQPSAPAAAAQPATASAGIAPGGGALGDEVAQLDKARKALSAGEGETCLGHLNQYKAKFPKGQLAAEAQAMRASCEAKRSPTP